MIKSVKKGAVCLLAATMLMTGAPAASSLGSNLTMVRADESGARVVSDGIYNVPVSIWHATNDTASMGNQSLVQNGVVTVTGGVATLRLTLQPMMMSGIEGYLDNITVAGATVTVVDRFSNGYPKTLDIPVTVGSNVEYMTGTMFIPAMESIMAGMGTQNMRLKVDYTNLVTQLPADGYYSINGTVLRSDSDATSGAASYVKSLNLKVSEGKAVAYVNIADNTPVAIEGMYYEENGVYVAAPVETTDANGNPSRFKIKLAESGDLSKTKIKFEYTIPGMGKHAPEARLSLDFTSVVADTEETPTPTPTPDATTGATTATTTATTTAATTASTTAATTAAKKKTQSISGTASYKKAYGAKAFTLNAKTNGNGKLSYSSSNTKVATVNSAGKVTLKGTGRTTITVKAASTTTYNAASKKVTITVVPKKQTIKKLTTKKKQLTVQYTKDTRVSGYQIRISRNKSFTGSTTKTYTVTSYKTYKKTIKKLKSKKTYYVKVRGYKTISGTKNYGTFSATKKVKVK